MKIAFLIVDYNISGGMKMIVRHGTHLARRGHQVFLVSQEPLPAHLRGWFEADGAPWHGISYAEAGRMTFDAAIVTYYSTLFDLKRIRAEKYFHLLQGIPAVLERHDFRTALVAALMAVRMNVIAVSAMLCEMAVDRFGADPAAVTQVRNGIDKNCFYPPSEERNYAGPLRILVEGAVDAPLKNIDAAIRVARQGGAGEIVLLTPSPIRNYPGVDRVVAQVTALQAAELCRSCHLLVKTSLSEGMCLPPLEMFHCGGSAVMYALPALRDYAHDGDNCLLVAPGDEPAAIAAVARLNADRALLVQLCRHALLTARNWPDEETAAAELEKALQNGIPGDGAELARTVAGLSWRYPLARLELLARRRAGRWRNQWRNAGRPE